MLSIKDETKTVLITMQRFSPTRLVATYSSILFMDPITSIAELSPASAFDLIVPLSHDNKEISEPAKIACMHNKIKVINGRVYILIFYPLNLNFSYPIILYFEDC